MKTTAQLVMEEADFLDVTEYNTPAATATTVTTPVTSAVVDGTAQVGFDSFNLPEKLLQALNRMEFKSATPIQAQTIPLALQGRDILGSAQTGTGKTGAFGIPLIAKLLEDPKACALVMTPTRELASQVLASLQQMIPVPTIKTALLIGGEAMPKQFNQLKLRPRIIVGTPGRINDHLARHTLDLRYTRFLVLDETDRMLDMGFGVQIDKILAYMPNDNRQTLMFSATMPPSIVKMSQKYMSDAARIAVGSTTTPAAKIKQEVIQTPDAQKYDYLLQELGQREGSVIVFVRTKHGADRMADKLCRDGHLADAIHGDLQQRKRDRVIQNFRDKKNRILVATDVAARGLDIPHIEHVINYDLPQVPEDYIHRIGRTARAGAEGAAINFVSPSEVGKWKAIQRLINDGESTEDSFTGKGKRGSSNGGNQRRSSGSAKPFGKKDYGSQQWKGSRYNGANENRQERRSDNRSDNRFEGRSDNRSDNRFEGRSDNRSDNRFEGRSNNRSDNRFEGRSDNRSDNRFGGRSDNSGRPSNRFEGRSDNRSDNRFDNRGSDNRSGGGQRQESEKPREPRFGGFGAGRSDRKPFGAQKRGGPSFGGRGKSFSR